LEIGKGFIRNGFPNIILFNGHGGNTASLNLVSEQLADLGAMVLTINWWLDYKETTQKFAPDTGHAGEDETSVIMASDPSYVDLENVSQHTIPVPRNLKFKNMGKVSYPGAYSGDAASATAQKGEHIYQALLPLIVKDIEVMWTFSEK
jgi:creatinine amidohydrolase